MAKRVNKSEEEGRAAATPATVYVVVNPVTYGDPEVRHEAGEEVTDVPADSLPWLLGQGHITVKGDD